MTPGRWRGAVATAQGGSHTLRDELCQDASFHVEEPGLAFVALADGHGDPRHPRSREGARFAVEAAAQVMMELGRTLRDHPEDWTAQGLAHMARNHLTHRVAWEWNLRVHGHQAPEGTSPAGAWSPGLKAYGTTLLAALATDRFVLLWRLGDGAIVGFPTDRTPSVLRDDLDGLAGKATWSLSSPGFNAHVDVSVVDLDQQDLPFLLLFTDGLGDSLDDDPERWIRLGRNLQEALHTDGWEPMAGWIDEMASIVAQDGVGDDVSIGVLARVPKLDMKHA